MKTDGIAKSSSTSELAEILDLSGERIRQLTVDGVFTKEARGQYRTAQNTQRYFHQLRVQTYGEAAAEIIRDLVQEVYDLQKRLDAAEARLKRATAAKPNCRPKTA